MRLDIVTIFPTMFNDFLHTSIVKRAQDNGVVEIRVVDLRRFTSDPHKTVDDKPYGGGVGMVMKVEPLFEAVEHLRTQESITVLLTPQGNMLNQALSSSLSTYSHIIFLCGQYEGVDDRVRSHLVDMEISIGDYILTSGSLAAMVVTDSVIRLLPGVLGSEDSIKEESFGNGLLEYPQFTRPSEYRGMKVPQVLLNGNHQSIEKWRSEQSLKRTIQNRPDLLKHLNSNGQMN